MLYAVLDADEKAREMLERVVARRDAEYVSGGFIAAVYANLDEPERAFEWLDRAYEEKDSWLFNLHYPELDAIRSDPRFEALLVKLKLPVEAYR